jgi:hypothetical protein
MASKIQIRRDTAANWTATNPVLAQGEPGLETDTSKVKYGDGTTPWADLEYASAGGGLTEADATTHPVWIAVNSFGGTSYSRDAETWTPTYYPGMSDGSNESYNVAIGPDAVVYAGQNNNNDPVLYYAPNAWSKPVELLSTRNVTVDGEGYTPTWVDVIYGGGYYVACGYLQGEGPAGPAWAYSTDGYNWTTRGQESGGVQFNRVVYNGTGWLFGALDYSSNSGDGYFVSDITTAEIYSEPTWTDDLSIDLEHVGWSGNSWVAFDSSAAGYYGVARFSSNANVALDANAIWSANANVASIVYDTLRYIPDNEGSSFVKQASGPITFEGNTKNWHMFGAYTGAVAATVDNGADYVVSVPAPYTAPIVYIDSGLAEIEIPSYNTEQIWDSGEAERITISNASVSGYNGTYYARYLRSVDDIEQYRIYTNVSLTTLANASAWANLSSISGNATLTWSHGHSITGMAIAGNVAFVGNSDDDLFTSTDLQNWTRVVDNDDVSMTGFVDVAYVGSTVTGTMPATGNIQLTGAANWYISDPVTFTIVNSNDGGEDVITANVTLTRSQYNDLYNSQQEDPEDTDYNENKVTPRGTVWNADGWHDFSNVKHRPYTNLYRALSTDEPGTFSENIIGVPLVMKDVTTGRYFAIKFTGYGNDEEPYVQYTRREINPDYQPGIRFADGTTQTTAYSPILARHTSPGLGDELSANEWRCEQASGMTVIEWPGGNEYSSVAIAGNIVAGSNITFNPENYVNLAESLQTWVNSEERNAPASLQFNNSSVVYRITDYTPIQANLASITFTSDSTPFRPNANVGVNTMTVQVPAEPIKWWDAADLPNGAYNFRGAIIDYHAYAHSNAGNFIGQIMIAMDDNDARVTHSETTSGGTYAEESFWARQYAGNKEERRLYYRGRSFDNERVIIQWVAKVYYGAETYYFYD